MYWFVKDYYREGAFENSDQCFVQAETEQEAQDLVEKYECEWFGIDGINRGSTDTVCKSVPEYVVSICDKLGICYLMKGALSERPDSETEKVT